MLLQVDKCLSVNHISICRQIDLLCQLFLSVSNSPSSPTPFQPTQLFHILPHVFLGLKTIWDIPSLMDLSNSLRD